MGEGKKILTATLLIFILFLGAGKILFDKKHVREDQANGFFDALTNEKSINFFSKIKGVLKNYKCMEIEVSGSYARKLFYNLEDGRPKKISFCNPEIIIKMNDHSVAGIIYGSYNMNGAVFSEIATGNLKIEGLSAEDIFRLL